MEQEAHPASGSETRLSSVLLNIKNRVFVFFFFFLRSIFCPTEGGGVLTLLYDSVDPAAVCPSRKSQPVLLCHLSTGIPFVN